MGPRPEIWDCPNIALVSSSPSTFSEEIMGRLRRRQWHISLKTKQVGEAFKAFNEGKCSVLMIHDTPELPASFVLRAQIADPVATLTPTMVICHPAHNQDLGLLKEIGIPELIDSSINPAAFIGGFEYLIRRWSSGSLRKVYQARRYLLDRQFLPFSKLMTLLKSEADLQPLVTPCTAQILMRQTDFKSVETLLLNALKEHPRNIGIIANLVEFYLRAAMPETALKLLAAARKNHGSPRILCADQIQAHLMLNQVSACIHLLEELIKEDYCREQAEEFLARCLFAEGYSERFQRLVAHESDVVDDYKLRWNKSAS